MTADIENVHNTSLSSAPFFSASYQVSFELFLVFGYQPLYIWQYGAPLTQWVTVGSKFTSAFTSFVTLIILQFSVCCWSPIVNGVLCCNVTRCDKRGIALVLLRPEVWYCDQGYSSVTSGIVPLVTTLTRGHSSISLVTLIYSWPYPWSSLVTVLYKDSRYHTVTMGIVLWPGGV